jgi:hypothetical protein
MQSAIQNMQNLIQPNLENLASTDEEMEYVQRYTRASVEEARINRRYVSVDGVQKEIHWAPQAGSQNDFLAARGIFELLYHGTRGPGKTDALLMAFANEVGRGYGAAWRGIIFRQSYPQLADVQAKSEKWFKLIFGNRAKFNRSKMMWEWDTGEVLLLRHMNSVSDYFNYHGHEYPFIGWEELCNWATDECFKSMFSCCRSSTLGVPRMIRATTNPYGPGHNWVKERYRLHGNWRNTVLITDAVDSEGRKEPIRCAIHGNIKENKLLLEADPNYEQTIIASASNPAMARAWLEGSWDIIAGGMFGDVWDKRIHVLEPFAIPDNWKIDRSFDWGSSAPFSVGWWAESDGSDVKLADGTWKPTVRGDLFRIAEWYGWNGKPNKGIHMLATDVAKGIIQREKDWGWLGRVKAGPADSAIFSAENGNCIATDMQKQVRLDDGSINKGVLWLSADKRPGSRKTGWEQVRKVLQNSKPPKMGTREQAGLFVFSTCDNFLRTVPTLPRDEKNMDDVDTNAEDHVGDEVRYRVRMMNQKVGNGRTLGGF